MDSEYDILAVMEKLPHRYPFLLVDRVIKLIPHEKIVALKNVTFNEPFFQGHFPGKPVMPGVLIIEAMAQAGGILAYETAPSESATGLFILWGWIKSDFAKWSCRATRSYSKPKS